MVTDHLTPDARKENAATLAAALGITIPDAEAALDIEIAVTNDSTDETACAIASDLTKLLERTVRVSQGDGRGSPTAEVVVGGARQKYSVETIFVDVDTDGVTISAHQATLRRCSRVHGLFGLVSACYAAGASLQVALGERLSFGPGLPIRISFSEFGLSQKALVAPIGLGRVYLAGAGAIGNGFLLAARHLDLEGELHVVDDDTVSSGNLNRQIWFNRDDIGKFKADQLVAKAQPYFTRLALKSRTCRLQELSERSEEAWLQRLIVAVDSRRARRSLQNEFPREVFDASTTDVREIVLHYHAQPNAAACLSCIYEVDEQELSRERHIAEHLGVEIEEVRKERISRNVAQRIATKFPELDADTLVGTAFDSLFKQLCAESLLKEPSGRVVLAPFAFVSVLAGTLLALEVARRLNGGGATDFNYWRLSPWHTPLARRRLLRPKQSVCVFCGNPVLAAVNADLWR